MKKIFFIALFTTVVFSITLYAQDTVHRTTDPWYQIPGDSVDLCFHNYIHQAVWYSEYYEHNYYRRVQGNYSYFDTLYGIAFTSFNFPPDTVRQDIYPYFGLYNKICAINYSTDSIGIIDSLTMDNVQKDCWYDYEVYDIVNNKPVDSVVPSKEFYFDHPYRMADLTNPFYLSIIWPTDRRVRYLEWLANNCTDSNIENCRFYPVHAWIGLSGGNSCNLLWIQESWGYDTLLFTISDGFWGALFPIVKLRCTAPYPRIAGHGDNSATITWWQAERGENYQLSLGPYGGNPDSGMLVTPTDTFYTFTGLQTDSIYSAWVRKACRYTTAGYDTLVWSDWSRPVIFRASVGIGEVDDMTLQVTARDGGIAVPGLAAGERAEVFDMQGRRVASLPSDGVTPPLPQGVYLLRTTAHSHARKVVLTR